MAIIKMKLSDYDYNLPPELIAQTPLEKRDSSRLLILDRESGNIVHSDFSKLPELLTPGDLLVINRTKVIHARLFGVKEKTGGKVEVLLLKQLDERSWEAIVGGKRVKEGLRVRFDGLTTCLITKDMGGPRRVIEFSEPINLHLQQLGHVPLPPYIHETLDDPDRYQTIFADHSGSAAAPTAGLHFTDELVSTLKDRGIGFAYVTLHIGLDTFAPITEEDPRNHRIHTEWCSLGDETAALINKVKKNDRKIIAVGTTSVRTIETAAKMSKDVELSPFEGDTDLFIYPGFKFQAVDQMITNFHLPRSSLLLLVSAFAGRKSIFNAYKSAINEKYRFYSFGDAMFIC